MSESPYRWAAEALQSLTGDPESDLTILNKARLKWPEDQQLLLAEVAALTNLDRHRDAEALLREAASTRGDATLWQTLGSLLRKEKRHEDAYELGLELLSRDDEEIQIAGHEIAARADLERDRHERAELHLRSALKLRQENLTLLMLLAEIARKKDDLKVAMRCYDQIVAFKDDAGPWDIERVVVGSRLGEWRAVRTSASRLGVNLGPGEGAPDRDWGPCQLLFSDGRKVMAKRTGPATALIESPKREIVAIEPGPIAQTEGRGTHRVLNVVPA